MSYLSIERLGLGLRPEIKGLGLVPVSRKFWKVLVSVSSRPKNQNSWFQLGLEPQRLVYIPESNLTE